MVTQSSYAVGCNMQKIDLVKREAVKRRLL